MRSPFPAFTIGRSARITSLAVITSVCCIVGIVQNARLQSIAGPWSSYGHDPQHTAISTCAAQPLTRVHWTAPVDLQPQYSGGALFIHYGSPLCTANNTVIFPVKTGTSEGYRFEARKGTTGVVVWMQSTDYRLPPHNWIPSVSGVLTPKNRLYIPGIGGRLYYRDSPDTSAPSGSGVVAFYGSAAYSQNPGAFNNQVFINTPITTDRYGNLYFGVLVQGTPAPIAGLQSCLVRVTPTNVATWVNVSAAAPGMAKLAHNCAPALSNDHKYLYVTMSNQIGFGSGCLAKLDAQTLKTINVVPLMDVKNPDMTALIPDDGTASPTVGPDGDVYYGVLENPFFSNHLRGWLLHFNADLTQQKTPGPFGWDDSASVVPSKLVASYHGSSSYLLMTKYNNYVEGGGDGVNKVGIFDPNATMVDPISGATVMKEVLAIAGPTADPGHIGGHPQAVREWCINTAAVDTITKSIMVNNEDGATYRWDLTTNKLSQRLVIQPPTGEAYTPTIIGVDGTVYAINNATLCALGK